MIDLPISRSVFFLDLFFSKETPLGPISRTFAALLARAGIVKDTWQLISPRGSACLAC
jgi:hypothetical protein